MKIRFDLCLILDPTDVPAKDALVNYMENLKPKLERLNLEETSYIQVQKCYHDETPVKPCEVILEWHKE